VISEKECRGILLIGTNPIKREGGEKAEEGQRKGVVSKNRNVAVSHDNRGVVRDHLGEKSRKKERPENYISKLVNRGAQRKKTEIPSPSLYPEQEKQVSFKTNKGRKKELHLQARRGRRQPLGKGEILFDRRKKKKGSEVISTLFSRSPGLIKKKKKSPPPW